MAKGIKTGGRQKGTSNKLTGSVKEMITQLIENEVKHLPGLLNQMQPKEKADLVLKLLPYIIPKIASVDAPKEKPQRMDWQHIRKMMNTGATSNQS